LQKTWTEKLPFLRSFKLNTPRSLFFLQIFNFFHQLLSGCLCHLICLFIFNSWVDYGFSLWSSTLLGLGVLDTCPCHCLTPTGHLWLHWIMSFFRIIIGVAVSCSVSVSVSVFHRF
jgi:hypothetical protein